jgi:hypothetical protein
MNGSAWPQNLALISPADTDTTPDLAGAFIGIDERIGECGGLRQQG